MNRDAILELLRQTPADEIPEVLRLLEIFERAGHLDPEEAQEWRRCAEPFLRFAGDLDEKGCGH